MNKLSAPTDATKRAVAYFHASQEYFWRWAEQEAVVEWKNGATICYRQELAQLLTELAPSGLPTLSTLLLLLAACQGSWAEANGQQILEEIAYRLCTAGKGQEEEVAYLLEQAATFLDSVAALPRELRQGAAKLHLLHTIFSSEYRPVSADWARDTVEEWTSGRLDAVLATAGPAATLQRLEVDIALLIRASKRFPAAASLELHIRTGLAELPIPLPAPEVAERAVPLLDQLAEDARTVGLARLAQRVVAALHIPLHTQGASDQPIGGVSDVANRGSFDRLLLSELAHDDLSLLARLVNNEALYLRREEPPQPQPRPRTILLDTTLRLWGVPRVFALSAALAWAQNARAPRTHTGPLEAYALGGSRAQAIDITTKAGIVEALGILDPALHCGEALQAFLDQEARAAQLPECLLITEAQLLHQPAFTRILAHTPGVRFLLTVDRTGELQFYEYARGHRTQLSTTRFDLDALLFAPLSKPRWRLADEEVAELPHFLSADPCPLYLPTTGIRSAKTTVFYDTHLGAIGVSTTQRLLYWPQKERGARELLPVIESGTSHFGFEGDAIVYLLICNPYAKRLKLYTITPEQNLVSSRDLASKELAWGSNPTPPEITYHAGVFSIVLLEGSSLAVDCRRQQIVPFDPGQHLTNKKRPVYLLHQVMKRHINNGYTVLQRVNQMGVNVDSKLTVEGYVLQLTEQDTQLELQPRKQDGTARRLATFEPEPLTLVENPNVVFRRLTWADGSVAVIDPRGLLHLRSSDANLPELTVVLVIGKPTAAWASNGVVAGSTYFTGSGHQPSIPAVEFYDTYLQRFIDRLA